MAWYDDFAARHAQTMADAIARQRVPATGSFADRSAQAVARAVAGQPVSPPAFGRVISKLSETADAIQRKVAAEPLNRASPEHAEWEAALDALRSDYEMLADTLDRAATQVSGEVNPAAAFQAGSLDDSLRSTIGAYVDPAPAAPAKTSLADRAAAARARMASSRNPYRELENAIEQEILRTTSPIMRGDGTIEVSQFGPLGSPELQRLFELPDAQNALIGLARKYGIQGAGNLRNRLINRIVEDRQARSVAAAAAGGARASGGGEPARPKFDGERTLVASDAPPASEPIGAAARRRGRVIDAGMAEDDIPVMESFLPIAVTRNVSRPVFVLNPATGNPKVDELGLPLERGSRTVEETGVYAGRTYTDANGNVVTEPDMSRPLIELVKARTGGDGNRSPESVVWLSPRDDGTYQVVSIDQRTGQAAAPSIATATDVDRLLREGYEPTTAGDSKPRSVLGDSEPGAIGRMVLEASKSGDLSPQSMAAMLRDLRTWRLLGTQGDMATILREAGAGDAALGQQRVDELLSRAIDATTPEDARSAASSSLPVRALAEQSAAEDAARRAEELASRARQAAAGSGIVTAQEPFVTPVTSRIGDLEYTVPGALGFRPLPTDSLLAGLNPQATVDVASAGSASGPPTAAVDVTAGAGQAPIIAAPASYSRQGIVVGDDGVPRIAGVDPRGGSSVDDALLSGFAEQLEREADGASRQADIVTRAADALPGDAERVLSPLDALLYGRRTVPQGQLAFDVTDGSWASGVASGANPAVANLARAVQSSAVGDYLGNPIVTDATTSSAWRVEPFNRVVEPNMYGAPGTSSISAGALNVRNALQRADGVSLAREARMARGDAADDRMFDRSMARASVMAGEDVPTVEDPQLRAEAAAEWDQAAATRQVISDAMPATKERGALSSEVLRRLFASQFGRPGKSGKVRVRYPVGLGSYDARLSNERVGQGLIDDISDGMARIMDMESQIDELQSRIANPGPEDDAGAVAEMQGRLEGISAERDALQSVVDSRIDAFASDRGQAIDSAGSNQARLVEAFMDSATPFERTDALRQLLGTDYVSPAEAMDGIRRAAAAQGMPEPSDADIIYSILRNNRQVGDKYNADGLYDAAQKAADDLASAYDRKRGSAAAAAEQPKVGEYGLVRRALEAVRSFGRPGSISSRPAVDPAGALDPLFRRLPDAQSIRAMSPEDARRALSEIAAVEAQLPSVAGDVYGPPTADYASNLRSAIAESKKAVNSVLNPSGVASPSSYKTEAQIELADVNRQLSEIVYAMKFSPESYDDSSLDILLARRDQLLEDVPYDSPEAVAARELSRPATKPVESRPATITPNSLPGRPVRSRDAIMAELAPIQKELDDLEAQRNPAGLASGRDIASRRGPDGGGPEEYRAELARRAKELRSELQRSGGSVGPESLARAEVANADPAVKPPIPAGQIDFSVFLAREDAERMQRLVSNPGANLTEGEPGELLGPPVFEVRDLPGGRAEITMRRRMRWVQDGKAVAIEPEHKFVGEITDPGSRRNDRFTVSFGEEGGAVKPTLLEPEWTRRSSEASEFEPAPVVQPASRSNPQRQTQAQRATAPPPAEAAAGRDNDTAYKPDDADAEDAAVAADLAAARESASLARQRQSAIDKNSEIESANRRPPEQIDFREVLEDDPPPRRGEQSGAEATQSRARRLAGRGAKALGVAGGAYMLGDLGQDAGLLPTSSDLAAAGILAGGALMAAPVGGALVAGETSPEDTNQEVSRVVGRIRQARSAPYYTAGNILPY